MIQASLRLSRFIVVIAAAALLTPASFAAVVLSLSLTDLIRGGLQAFDVFAVRLLSRGGDAATVIQAGLDAKTLAGVAGAALAGALAALLYDIETAWLVAISGAGTLAGGFAASFLVRQQAALELRSISSTVMTATAIGTAACLLLAWFTHSAVWVVVGTALGDGLLLAMVCGRHVWRRPDWRTAIAQIRQSRGLLAMQLAYIGQFRIGTIVLGAAGTAVAVGEYAIASRVAEGLAILASALTASSLPMIGAAHARNERAGLNWIFARSYDAGLRLTTPLIGTLVITAPIWIAILVPNYPNVGPPSAIVGLAVIIFFASSQTTALLNATFHDRAASSSAVAGLAASAIAMVPLVSLGAIGVAWARVVGELVRMFVEGTYCVRKLEIRPGALVRPWLLVIPVLAGMAGAVAWNWQPPLVWVAVAVVLTGSAAGLLLRGSSAASRTAA